MSMFTRLFARFHNLLVEKTEQIDEHVTDVFEHVSETVRGMKAETVKEKLDELAAADGQKLDWEHSIVDLLKLIKMPHDLHARQQLAALPGFDYHGQFMGTDKDNIWLHRKTMEAIKGGGLALPELRYE